MNERLISVICDLYECFQAQYDDKRCICICPKLHTVINTTQSLLERQTYVINVPPSQW